jgi:hypothetical protein
MSDGGEEFDGPIFGTPFGPANLMKPEDLEKYKKLQQKARLRVEVRTHHVFGVMKDADEETLEALAHLLSSIVGDPEPLAFTQRVLGVVHGIMLTKGICPSHLMKHGDDIETELAGLLAAEEGEGSGEA